jgi:SWI/SNF-related matrix-associated actin-dependent regulator 1 of chromatin subfamily A
LAPFQKQGVEFILRNEGRALLADDMGLGKTRTSIAAAVAFAHDWPVLIVCPSSARHNWQAELTHLLVPVCLSKSDILVVESASQSLTRRSGTYKFIIISYALMQRMATKTQDANFGILICDECHYLKNGRANRTKALVPMIKAAKRAILISGTPALSRPMELFTQLNALNPKAWPDEREFGRRYCGSSDVSAKDDVSSDDGAVTTNNKEGGGSGSGSGISEFKGASNTQELHVMLTSTLMIRRQKKDILLSLPEKRREVVKVEIANVAKRERLRQLLQQFRAQDGGGSSSSAGAGETNSSEVDSRSSGGSKAANKRAAPASGVGGASSVAASTDVAVASANAKKERMGLLLQLFNLSGEAKLEAVLPHVQRHLDDPHSGQLLIFAHHRTVMDRIAAYIVGRKVDLIRIDGQTSGKDRHENTKYFQSTPSCRVALLAITAAGISITLTAASTVFFAEMFWTPGSLIQAEDRAHRIGQTRKVHVKYFLADNTVDDVLWPLVKRKVQTLGEVVEGDGSYAMFSDEQPAAGTAAAAASVQPPRQKKAKRSGAAATAAAEEEEESPSAASLHVPVISRAIIDLTKDLGVQELETARTLAHEDERDELDGTPYLDDDEDDLLAGSSEEAISPSPSPQPGHGHSHGLGPARSGADRHPDVLARYYMSAVHDELNNSIAHDKMHATADGSASSGAGRKGVIYLSDSDEDDEKRQKQKQKQKKETFPDATDLARVYLQSLASHGVIQSDW